MEISESLSLVTLTDIFNLGKKVTHRVVGQRLRHGYRRPQGAGGGRPPPGISIMVYL